MRSFLKIKIQRAYSIAFLLLLLSYAMIFFILYQLNQKTQLVTHSYDVINTLNSLKGEITDAETGVRGYIITKDSDFLAPYRTGSRSVMPLYDQLKQLTADNKKFQPAVDSLEKLLSKKMDALTTGLALFQKNGMVITPEMTANRDVIKSATDSIRLIMAQLTNSEQTSRRSHDQTMQTVFSITEIITITSLIIAFLTAVLAYITYNKEKKAKEKADLSVKLYSKRLEESFNKLQHTNQELLELKSLEKFAFSGRIARTIAHEVRNPLTNISLATEQLKEMNSGNADFDILIEMIKRNSGRINQLVSELLTSTRFTKLNYEMVNMNEVLDGSLQLALDRSDLKKIKIEKKYAQDIQPTRIDKEKIKLAFLNIIMNAIEAMEKDSGMLEITTSNKDGKCIVEFKDNGSGMNESIMQRIFEPYFTSKPKGTGLGLTNTQNIILNHEGSISVHSKEGEGTTFTIVLNQDQHD